ncbi:MAG: hypothetical protein Fur0018_13660 [Anaerolineales bacterium]
MTHKPSTLQRRLSRAILALVMVLSLLGIAVPAAQAAPPDDFVIAVKTDNPGTSSSTQFTIPTHFTGYNYNVDCNNDGTDEATGQTGSYTCTYGSAGTYTIRIKDNSGLGTGFPRIYFANGGDRLKILIIEQWGTGKWDDMNRAFSGAANLQINATDAPDLSSATSLAYMFSGASSLNADLSGWNTATITDMSYMFQNTTAFNGNITTWDTSSVTNMAGMFQSATSFNQDISGWNTGNVVDMINMFAGATSFDQDLSNWNVTSLTNASLMFNGVTLSTANYDALLIGWNAQALQSGVPFDGGGSTYCAGEAARTNMISSDLWTISDGGKDCSAAAVTPGAGGGNGPGSVGITDGSSSLELWLKADAGVTTSGSSVSA